MSSIDPGPGVPAVIYQQVVRPASNGTAIASLVLGIVAIVFGIWMVVPIIGLVFAFLSFAPAVLAVVFGITGLKRSSVVGVGRGFALAGLVTGGVTLLIGLLTTLVWIVAFAASAGSNAGT